MINLSVSPTLFSCLQLKPYQYHLIPDKKFQNDLQKSSGMIFWKRNMLTWEEWFILQLKASTTFDYLMKFIFELWLKNTKKSKIIHKSFRWFYSGIRWWQKGWRLKVDKTDYFVTSVLSRNPVKSIWKLFLYICNKIAITLVFTWKETYKCNWSVNI